MTTPPLGPGDLLVASAGPGSLHLVSEAELEAWLEAQRAVSRERGLPEIPPPRPPRPPKSPRRRRRREGAAIMEDPELREFVAAGEAKVSVADPVRRVRPGWAEWPTAAPEPVVPLVVPDAPY
jgi:hypothetical protein